ncbi:site-specific DNA-methyltransferase [[Pasteurella] aerogenes]|nr:site-specific DNA-methyltransferase [[Pasteurella] aerogenes]
MANFSLKDQQLLQLKSLLPEIFSEGQIDFDKFKQLFADNISTDPDRYHLNWAGKSQAYQQLQIPTHKTLTPCVEESVNFEQTQNIFIEGENLDVLKALQKSYFNSVKMIYIDPPYNTGNDFVYNDNFAQSQADYQTQTGEIGEDGLLKKAFRKNSKENGHYHSNWLNMMLPRLHLARNLLKDDGVIFISIDDNEQAQLKLLCDEVFGEENFVANFIWNNKYTVSNDTDVSYQHEHILCYAKNRDSFQLNLLERTEKQNKDYKNRDNDPKGEWKATPIHARSGSVNSLYQITFPNGYSWEAPAGRYPRYSKERLLELYNENALYFNKNGGVDRKTYLSEVRSGVTCGTLWSYEDVGHSHGNNEELAEIIGKGVFSDPKGTSLLERILTLSTKNDSQDIILDFFAGSGSTAHAIIRMNKKDKGNRRFICVQLPEIISEKEKKSSYEFCKNLNVPAVISEISKERIRRAGSQILQKNDENKPLDIGFKVFKLTDSHFKQWQSPTAENLSEQLEMFIDNVKDGAEPQAMLYEILLRLGLKLTAKVQWENSVFWIEDEKSQHYAILLERIDEALLAGVIAQQPLKVVALDRLFAGNDALKKNAELQMKDAAVAFFVI